MHKCQTDSCRRTPRPARLSRSRATLKAVMQPEVAAWAATQGVAIVTAIVTAFLLAGCATGIKPQATLTPAQQLASAQTFGGLPATGNWPAADWWTQYNDPQLNALMDEALTDSPDLRVAQARLRRANALSGLAEGQAGPSLSAGGQVSRERYSANFIYPPPLGGSTYTIDQAGLNFSWDIDFWGKSAAAIDAAHLQAHATEADGAAARLALTTSVARAYFQLERLYALKDVADAATHQREDVLRITTQRASAGLDTNVEVRQSEATVPQSQLMSAQIAENIALAQNQMAALLGKGPDRGLTFTRPVAVVPSAYALPADVPAALVGRRPDLVAARWRVEASQSDIAGAKAAFYPDFNIVAAANLISLSPSKFLESSSLDRSFGPAITLPIFQGSLRANLRAKDADYDLAVEQYNQIVLQSLRDVADQITSIKSLQGQQVQQTLALSKTEQAYDLATQRYKAGITNFLTVLAAQNAVLEQQRANAEMQARALDLNVNLIRALGGGYAVLEPKLAQR